MEITIAAATQEDILGLRMLFLKESNFQFVYNKCHLYGWADRYLFTIGTIEIGYGAVWGQHKREDRDAIFEFFVLKPYRKFGNAIFQKFTAVAKATHVECQSNDALLVSMLYEYCQNINAESILFEDHFQTHFDSRGTVLKRIAEHDHPDDRPSELMLEDQILASGGLMLNHNLPYADLYYEVKENYRRQGFGTLMLQELKNEAYAIGRVPAARCNIRNTTSKAALLKAGFKVCGFVLNGAVKLY